jgi:D-glycero-D-manno-heptose 1,7-bisphosphate phosphatase
MSDDAIRPMALFDRDGVLNRDIGYAHRPEQIEWIDGALAALALVKARGYRTVVVTNQSGVARGLYEEADVLALHIWMAAQVEQAGGYIDAFYYCPYHAHAAVARYRADHEDRKPRPGMLHKAIMRFPTDMMASFLVGDRRSDLDAAAAMGIAGHLFAGDRLDLLVAEILAGNRVPETEAMAASGTHRRD